MNEERKKSHKAVLNQREAAEHLGITRHKLISLERGGFLQRIVDSNNGIAYLLADLERIWTNPRSTSREEK